MKNYLTVSMEAVPETKCTLTFVPPSGEKKKMDTKASQDGSCTWKWKIEESYGTGDARLIFTVNGVSDTHFIQIFKEF